MNHPPSYRRKTPSFSSLLLDSILRSLDDVDDHMSLASEPKRTTKTYVTQKQLTKEEQQSQSLHRAIMIDRWMETRDSCSSTSGTTTTTLTTSSSSSPSPTYTSLPNSFTISRKLPSKNAETIFINATQKASSSSSSSSTNVATNINVDMKNVKQPVSPSSRISTFIYSLFASSSNKKKSRAIKQDAAMTCTSFSRSCMSKKQHSNGVKRSVRFYPDKKCVDGHDSSSMKGPKYESRGLAEKKYKSFLVNIEDEDDDEDEDDLFELEIGGFGRELPVFETTDLRKIRV